MTGIGYTVKKNEIKVKIASILHAADYAHFSTLPLNLEVFLFPDKKRRLYAHSGLGALTLPSQEVGAQFLSQFGGTSPPRLVVLGGKRIQFNLSKNSPKQDVLGICHSPAFL